MKRIGVFGGTFDPVHRGHLAILRAAQKHFGFDRVYVVPAYRNPLKDRASAPLRRRLMALRAAIRPLRFARLSLVEAGQGKPCYMTDTLRYFKRRHPRAELFLISGSDILDTFHRWKDPAGILRSATVAVAHRPGFRRPGARRGFVTFPMRPVRESSTRLRVSGQDPGLSIGRECVKLSASKPDRRPI